MKIALQTSVIVTFILSVFFAPELKAQDNLENMIEKLMSSNTTVQIINYNGDDKSLPTYTAKISIDEKSLMDEFIETFKSEQKSADFSVTNTKNGDDVTSAIFNKNGISYMYSYFVDNNSNGFVLYSKHKKHDAAKGNIDKLSPDYMRAENNNTLKLLGLGMKPVSSEPKLEFNSILLAIPYRINIPGKNIITDGVDFIKSDSIGFGTESKVPVKTDKKITILIPKGDYIYINKQKHTAEEARQKGLNVETF